MEEVTTKKKKPNFKTRICSIFKASACSSTAKAIFDDVQPPVFLASNPLHFDESTLFNLHLSHSGIKEEVERRDVFFYDARGKKKKKNKKKKKKLYSNPYGFTSSSSSFSCDDGGGGEDGDGVFSSDNGEEETGTLLSSRSFSSDSSDFYYNSSLCGKKGVSRTPRKKPSRRESRRHDCTGHGFRPLVSISSTTSSKKDKKKQAMIIGDGVPVAKNTSDPYADFRISMLEMIFEKQIFGKEELDHLLRSFLALNSHDHHSIIEEVFHDICEVLFIN